MLCLLARNGCTEVSAPSHLLPLAGAFLRSSQLMSSSKCFCLAQFVIQSWPMSQKLGCVCGMHIHMPADFRGSFPHRCTQSVDFMLSSYLATLGTKFPNLLLRCDPYLLSVCYCLALMLVHFSC